VEENGMPFRLTTAFEDNDFMPAKFTCEGADISPELAWAEPPAGTRALALIMDDPDAPRGTFVHWVLYDLPPDTRSLAERLAKDRQLANGARQGRNDFGKIGYNGPCPPRDAAHRYCFKLYALGCKTVLKSGATKSELERAIKDHILAHAELVGRFQH
jgi:Raf kinase inhibitor-like YbhB/YbcL family protein